VSKNVVEENHRNNQGDDGDDNRGKGEVFVGSQGGCFSARVGLFDVRNRAANAGSQAFTHLVEGVKSANEHRSHGNWFYLGVVSGDSDLCPITQNFGPMM